MVSVQALEDFKLWVEFQDGTAGSIEMRDFVHAPDAGVFAGLADPARFAEVYVDFGVVTWPGGIGDERDSGQIDLAPDAMHREIRATGRWVLA